MKSPKSKVQSPNHVRNPTREPGARRTRSVLECGGPPPLFPRLTATCRPACASFQGARGLAHSKTWRGAVALLTFICATAVSSAQSYSIDWFKVAGGGGTSAGGAYSLTGTIGQHEAGEPMSGGPYSLTSGFWSLISVAQTPGAPTLSISRSGKTVTLYWQNVSGWTLEQTTSLTQPANWSPTSGVTTSNGTNYLNLASPAGTLFFRLRKP